MFLWKAHVTDTLFVLKNAMYYRVGNGFYILFNIPSLYMQFKYEPHMKIHHSQPCFDVDDESAVIQLLKSGFVSNGIKARELSKIIADLTGKNWGIATQSGTDALTLALNLAGVKEGDYVALPAYMCSAPLDAIALLGGVPIPLDIDRETLSVDPDKIPDQQDRMRTIIVPHLFGIPAKISEIENLCVIEDCAQTLGITVDGKKIGESGRFTVCSFYGTKVLTTGHGGMVLGNIEQEKEQAMDLITYDNREEWQPPYHFLMSDLNAALGISQIRKLNDFITRRVLFANRFTRALGENAALPNCTYSRFLIQVPDAEESITYFQTNGVEAKRPVYKPISMLLGLSKADYPETLWAYSHIVSVPIYPSMSDEHASVIERLLQSKEKEYSCWPPISYR